HYIFIYSPLSCHALVPLSPPPDFSTLSLHDALPIFVVWLVDLMVSDAKERSRKSRLSWILFWFIHGAFFKQRLYGRSRLAVWQRSEEHTSELQSRENLVCRLLLEKKKRDSDVGATQP